MVRAVCAPSLAPLCKSLRCNVAQGARRIVHVHSSSKSDSLLSTHHTHYTLGLHTGYNSVLYLHAASLSGTANHNGQALVRELPVSVQNGAPQQQIQPNTDTQTQVEEYDTLLRKERSMWTLQQLSGVVVGRRGFLRPVSIATHSSS
ncbi:hypothetical protein NQZ68_004313 [Dissostichus eleginoides]|nr:hypothetical protein NQZ68_004313 [Dissostichus eleginoides]